MPSPGEYRPDPTTGINHPHDLPPPRHQRQTRNRKYAPCPHCGKRCARRRTAKRTLHDIGNTQTGRPIDINFLFSVRCTRKSFDNATTGSYRLLPNWRFSTGYVRNWSSIGMPFLQRWRSFRLQMTWSKNRMKSSSI